MISLSKNSKRYILLYLLGIVSIFTAKGQTVSFYALTKKMHNGITSSSVTGGQFITFLDNICYESNKKGIGVGHGTLKLNKNYSNSNYKFYMGGSYWGTDATFKFKSDLSILNVILENGDIYVYKRQVASAFVTTCSLIRKRGSSSGNSGSYSPSFPNNGYDGGYVPNKNGSSSSSRIQNTTPSRKQPTKHTCSLCNGQRRIVKDTYPSLYGQSDYQVKCNECGGYFMRSIGHTHTTCPQCHGKGYFTTN